MNFYSKNIFLLYSLMLHFSFIILFSLKIPNLYHSNNTAWQNQVIMIDTIDIGELNNIKLQGKKGSINKKNIYNGIENKRSTKQEITKEIIKEITKQTLEKSVVNTKAKNKELAEKQKISNIKPIENKKKNTPDNAVDSSSNELASILKSIEKSKEKVENSNDEDNEDGLLGKGTVNYDKKNDPTIKVIDSIRSRFIKCWTVPIGAKDVENLHVKINITLSPTGKVTNANVYDAYNYTHDSFFRAMADSALRAIYNCNPLLNLPENLYQTWREIELNFDSKDMV